MKRTAEPDVRDPAVGQFVFCVAGRIGGCGDVTVRSLTHTLALVLDHDVVLLLTAALLQLALAAVVLPVRAAHLGVGGQTWSHDSRDSFEFISMALNHG